MSSAPSTKRLVPITDLGLEYQAIKPELMPLLDRILASGAYVLGPELLQFEKDLASYIGVPHAIGVNSGTDAVTLALRAIGLKAGDEVIVPAMSFFATVEPILLLDAIPIFVDIDPVSYAIDAKLAAGKITSKTKAIIAVHLYGMPADVKALSTLAKEKGISLIEDMAQAIGSACEGKKIGSWGDIACLSFYPTKNLGACGDAGAVLTSSDALADHVRRLRNHGAKVKYVHEEAAYNTRLDDIQAAILRLKLRHLDAWNEKRRALAADYTAALQDLPIVLPREVPGRHHVYHLYSIQAERREALKTFLQDQGISTGLHYPMALHRLPALQHLGIPEGRLPIGEKLAANTLSLPLYPFMTRDDVRYVSDHVRRFYQTHA